MMRILILTILMVLVLAESAIAGPVTPTNVPGSAGIYREGSIAEYIKWAESNPLSFSGQAESGINK